MNATLILNEKAGTFLNATDGLTVETLGEALSAAGIITTVRVTTGPSVVTMVEESIASKPDAIIVGGGDGTVSSVAALLLKTTIPLGVLPVGTLNHFARDLGYPVPWREAVTALGTATVRRIDVAEVNGRVFINNCSLGSYAEAVRRRDALRRQHGHGKWKAMFIASFTVFRELRRMRLRIETPSGAVKLRTPFLLVGNNRYAGHVLDSSLRPELDGGQLWLYTTRAKSRVAMLRMIWQSLIHRIDAADALDVRSTTEAVVSVEQGAVPVAADGELIQVIPPLRFRIRPQALHVLAPTLAPEKKRE